MLSMHCTVSRRSEESCHKLPGTLHHLSRDTGGESTDGVSIIRIPTDGQVMYQNHVGEHRTQFYNSYKSDCVDMWRPRVDTRFIHFSAPIVQTPRRVHLVFAPINNSPDSESWVLFKLLLCVHQLAIYNVILLFEVAHALLASVEKSVSPVPICFPTSSTPQLIQITFSPQIVGIKLSGARSTTLAPVTSWSWWTMPCSRGQGWQAPESADHPRPEDTRQQPNLSILLKFWRFLGAFWRVKGRVNYKLPL